MAKTVLVIRNEDVPIRKKTAPAGKAHKNAKAYRRKPKHAGRHEDSGSGPHTGGPFAFERRAIVGTRLIASEPGRAYACMRARDEKAARCAVGWRGHKEVA